MWLDRHDHGNLDGLTEHRAHETHELPGLPKALPNQRPQLALRVRQADRRECSAHVVATSTRFRSRGGSASRRAGGLHSPLPLTDAWIVLTVPAGVGAARSGKRRVGQGGRVWGAVGELKKKK